MARRILIIDDSTTVRQQVCLALNQAGFETEEASDGVEGLARLSKADGLSLAICDVNMPNLNGVDMLERLQAAQGKLAVPVLMLTTESQPKLIERAKKAGAKGWIVKPFKAEALVAVAKTLTKDG